HQAFDRSVASVGHGHLQLDIVSDTFRAGSVDREVCITRDSVGAVSAIGAFSPVGAIGTVSAIGSIRTVSAIGAVRPVGAIGAVGVVTSADQATEPAIK